MELKKGTIKQLQKYIAQKIRERGFEDETLHERLLLLAEEVGELIHASRKLSGMNIDLLREKISKSKEEVGEELVDVINMVFAVGTKLGIDIEKEFYKKEKIVNKRQYKRAKKK
jgi:NTP pyrophosphatase (non-canonical NTP hydrolase)